MTVNLLCKQCNLDTFCVLRQSFCGKFKIVCGFLEPREPPFWMYVLIQTLKGGVVSDVHTQNVSRTIYVNVDTPNLGFPYFNFLGGYQLKQKHPVSVYFRLSLFLI